MQISSVSTTPVVLNTLTLSEQKPFISLLFSTLNNKTDPNRSQKITVDSPSSEILKIVEKHLPMIAEIKKCIDYSLKSEVNRYFKNVDVLKKTFNGWSNLFESRVLVFETTCPHSQNDATQLQTIGSDYAALIEGDIKQLTIEKELLTNRITIRTKNFLDQKISLSSLQLLSNVHDVPHEYINANIQNDREHTDFFKKALTEMNTKYQELEVTQQVFKKNFCKVNHAINCLTDSYSFGYSLGLNQMPKYTASQFTVLKKRKNPGHQFSLDTLNAHQLNVIQNMCNILYQKHNSLKIEANLLCNDPFFKSYRQIIHCWTPLSVHKRKQHDRLLMVELPPLAKQIDSLAIEFGNLEQEYLTNILGLSKFPEMIDNRKKDLKRYANLSKPLERIAKEKFNLDEKLKRRIVLDIKDKVSTKTLKIICNSHDVTFEKLIKNIERFHENTKQFQEQIKQLADCTLKMNTKIYAFCCAFNYFSYLYENKLEDSFSNKSYFYVWYGLGYFNSIQVGKFKMPPQNVPDTYIPTAEETTDINYQDYHGFTEEEYPTDNDAHDREKALSSDEDSLKD